MKVVMILVFIVVVLFLVYCNRITVKYVKSKATWIDYIGYNLFFFAFIVFAISLISHQTQYYEQIDVIEGECYVLFGEKHHYTLLVYFLMYHIALFILWTKENRLPPLVLALSMSIVLIGIVLNVMISIQVIGHDRSVIPYTYEDPNIAYEFLLFPILSLLIGILILVKSLKVEHIHAKNRAYSNTFLNKCNQLLANHLLFCGAIIITVPLVVLIAIVLLLFGQDYNSITKAFTETATWTFSQHLPPPPKNHQGHYLCTVAASGSPNVVKPLRKGNRHGYLIMVNRQLLVANAFEELVQELSPRAHRVIRVNYDKYGYDLCRHITTAQRANLIYILMKPLEWFFLVSLYLTFIKPEDKIRKHYS